MSDKSNVDDAIVLVHLQKIQTAERKKDEAVNALRSARKAAKADGISLKTFDAVRHLAKLDEHEVTDDFNDMIRYARILQVPVYSQLELFAAPTAAEDQVIIKAGMNGLRAGRTGADAATNPYDPGSPAGQMWLEQWHKGQAELLSAIKKIPEKEPQPEQPRRPRGRPRKEQKPAEAPANENGDDGAGEQGSETAH